MTTQSNILVIGGTGKTGRKVVEGLKKRGQNVRIGSRNQSPIFEWNDPNTWAESLDGMDKAYVVYYPDLAVPGAYETISQFTEAAKNAGLQKVVLLSGKGEREAERCEKVVANSGLDYTLVRASWFNQNFSEGFLLESILAGQVALPIPEAQIPFVDTTDIAEVVVEALLNVAHNGKTYEITGPNLLTFEEAVQTIAVTTKRTIHYQTVSLEAYKSFMEAADVPTAYVWLLDYLFREVLSKPENQVITSDVAKILGRKATTFVEYAQRTAKTGVWNQAIAAFV